MNTFGTKILREYQKTAVNKILKCEDDKCVVKMFCGTGKSLVMITTILSLDSKTSVVVFPSLVLINQFINDARYNKPTINPTINTPYTLSYDNSDEFDDVVVLTKTKAK